MSFPVTREIHRKVERLTRLVTALTWQSLVGMNLFGLPWEVE